MFIKKTNFSNLLLLFSLKSGKVSVKSPLMAGLKRKLVGIALVFSFVFAQQVQGQNIYSMLDATTKFARYNQTANTWTTLAVPSGTGVGGGITARYSLAYDNTHIYALTSTSVVVFFQYNIATNTWTAKQAPTTGIPTRVTHSVSVVGVGNTIYAVVDGTFHRYDSGANTWTALLSVPNATALFQDVNGLVYDGTNIYTTARILVSAGVYEYKVYKYDMIANTWSQVGANIGLGPLSGTPTCATLVYNGIDIYAILNIGASGDTPGMIVYRLNKTTSTWTEEYNDATQGNPFSYISAVYDGNSSNKVHMLRVYDGSPGFESFTKNAGAGITIVGTERDPNSTFPTTTNVALVAAVTLGPPPVPDATVSAIGPTCNGSVVNSDGALQITALGAAVTKLGYSLGSSYTGPDFASATPISALPMTLVNTLPNYSADVYYTVRAFADATNYVDKVVVAKLKSCSTADLTLTISPNTPQTAAKGEKVTYTVTLNNAGPDAATNAVLSVPMPSKAKLLSTTPSVGNYNEVNRTWTVPTLASGSSATLQFTVEIK